MEVFEIIISFYQWENDQEIIKIVLTCRRFCDYVQYAKNVSKNKILKTIEQKLNNDNEFYFKMMHYVNNNKCIKCALVDNLGKICQKSWKHKPSQIINQDRFGYYNRNCSAVTCKDCVFSCDYCGFCRCNKCNTSKSHIVNNRILKAPCCGKNICNKCRFFCEICRRNNIVICSTCAKKDKISIIRCDICSHTKSCSKCVKIVDGVHRCVVCRGKGCKQCLILIKPSEQVRCKRCTYNFCEKCIQSYNGIKVCSSCDGPERRRVIEKEILKNREERLRLAKRLRFDEQEQKYYEQGILCFGGKCRQEMLFIKEKRTICVYRKKHKNTMRRLLKYKISQKKNKKFSSRRHKRGKYQLKKIDIFEYV